MGFLHTSKAIETIRGRRRWTEIRWWTEAVRDNTQKANRNQEALEEHKRKREEGRQAQPNREEANTHREAPEAYIDKVATNGSRMRVVSGGLS